MKTVLMSFVVMFASVLAAAETKLPSFESIVALGEGEAARAAVRRVKGDAVLLARLAREAKSWRLRADALYFLRDQEVMSEMLAKDADWRVRVAAVFHLQDGETLARVALSDPSPHVRSAAVRNLRDLSLLEKISREDVSAAVRQAAAQKLPPPPREAKEVPEPKATVVTVEFREV